MHCKDDEMLRRGKPTVHEAKDEPTAVLVGDGLQPLAFQAVAAMPVAPALIIQAIEQLTQAVGSQGMVGGQAIDCAHVGQKLDVQSQQIMHEMKTGGLFKASICLGGLV